MSYVQFFAALVSKADTLNGSHRLQLALRNSQGRESSHWEMSNLQVQVLAEVDEIRRTK